MQDLWAQRIAAQTARQALPWKVGLGIIAVFALILFLASSSG